MIYNYDILIRPSSNLLDMDNKGESREPHPFHEEVATRRKASFEINSIILNRWSPRAMTGEELSEKELMTLFEAARWAPSSFNNQPWRFIYANRSTEHWEKFLGLLADSNKIWAKDAAVLAAVVSHQNFEYNDKPSITHQFDAGAAWQNLALEAASRGLVAHGMQGFDYERARKELEIPETYDVMAMIAIGKRAPKENLPPKLQEREFPNLRKPLSELIMEGKFKH